jgi:hypothetical protein
MRKLVIFGAVKLAAEGQSEDKEGVERSHSILSDYVISQEGRRIWDFAIDTH